MIEDKIDALIAAMNNLTAVIAGGSPATNTPAIVATVVATAPKPKADKPKKAPAKSEEEIVKEVAQAAEAEVTVTKDQVSAAVQEMLKANKRQEAIDLLASFKAKSVSGLAEADYAAFVDGANEVLMAG
jgi:uncharacterized protein (DUF2267 family)